MKYRALPLMFSIIAMVALHGAVLAQDAEQAEEAAAWARISGSPSAEQLKGFLDEFPAGMFAREARQKYSTMTNAMLPPEVEMMDVRFPLDARRLGRTLGPMRAVQLNITVQPDGKAADVEMVKSSGFDRYDSAARQAAREATYLPALNRGMPVEARMEYEVSFGLL